MPVRMPVCLDIRRAGLLNMPVASGQRVAQGGTARKKKQA